SAPSVNLHPSNTGVVAGQTASFSAAATGNPTPTVKWQSSSDNSSWVDISGATSTTYSFTTSAGDNGLYYRAVFENSQGIAATNSARLIVGTVPTFTNPAYMTLAEGLLSGLTVAAPANPSPTLSISSGSLPNGVTFNPTTGLFSGIAAAGTAGTYPITFQATNGVGAPVTQNFILTVTTAVTGFDVSQGQSQRSYIRYLDVTMANSTEAANLASNLSRVRLIKADLNGIGSTPVALTGQVTAIGNRIAINFGAAGLGASRNSNAADGYYTLGLDLDNDGNFETSLFFHRLFGDVNGDGVVDATDDTAVTNGTKTSVPYNPNLDTNGDGTVNSNDVQYVRRALGRRIKAGLLITD
ncbi:MAG: hypothetical protein RL069_3021, partial [Planctomycetota bacterium]